MTCRLYQLLWRFLQTGFFVVMASQFESLLHPFVIMFAIPFALVGVVIALFITSKPISVIVLIGVVMLAGIVVNNAILLVDCINTRRREGMPRREAIIEGGRIRLRPIMMTTTTTVLGLLFSTLLTLVLVPVVYDIVEKIKESVWRRENI